MHFQTFSLQSAALGQSRGFVKSYLGSFTGWLADTSATLLQEELKLKQNLAR